MHDELRGPGRNFSPNAACRKLNPQLFGPGAVVGGLEASKPKQAQPSALDGAGAQREGIKGGVGTGCYRVALTVYRRKLMDSHDNVVTACKPLVDAIAQTLLGGTLGQRDGDIAWEYGQQVTKGREGVAVRVEILC